VTAATLGGFTEADDDTESLDKLLERVLLWRGALQHDDKGKLTVARGSMAWGARTRAL
jgi:hypothetical protein